MSKVVIVGGVAGGASAAARPAGWMNRRKSSCWDNGEYALLCPLRFTILYQQCNHRPEKASGTDTRGRKSI